MSAKNNYLFTYGTLRQEREPTHFIYGYELYNYYDKFPYVVPALAYDTGTARRQELMVKGNLVQLSDQELKACDKYEGLENKLFKRVKVPVYSLQSLLPELRAFVYLADRIAPTRIESGDWFVK